MKPISDDPTWELMREQQNQRWAEEGRRVSRETIEVLSRYILKNCNYNRLRDHACPQCMPEGGPLVKQDFVCAYHLAAEYVRQSQGKSCGP